MILCQDTMMNQGIEIRHMVYNQNFLNLRFCRKVVFWTISVILLVFVVNNARYNTLWSDEAYTVIMCKKGIANIIQWAGNDYQPPFYYFMFYCIYKIFGDSAVAFTMLYKSSRPSQQSKKSIFLHQKYSKHIQR